MEIASSAFGHEQTIPRKHTCEGPDLSPPLAWSDLPDGTQSLALIVDDPDAPDPAAPEMTCLPEPVSDGDPSSSPNSE